MGVQVILQVDEEVGFVTLKGSDFYVYQFDNWIGMDQVGLWDYVFQPGKKIIKCGRYVSNERFREILDIAIKDDNFPNKSGWYKHEERPRGE